MDGAIIEFKGCIEKIIDSGCKKFVIFPYEDIGSQIASLLIDSYGIKEIIKIDNHLCEYNDEIHPLSYLEEIKIESYAIILATVKPSLCKNLHYDLLKYAKESQIYEILSKNEDERRYVTKCGKHSYGPLIDHWLVESVGSFCSFARGTDVVANHGTEYISTSPFIYANPEMNYMISTEEERKASPWYIEGFQPFGKVHKRKRSIIGNDVWLGKNVTIINGANIGNGVIAGAGAIITKDVPDYAIVAGVPARIIKYRYTKEQIEALNRIKWWDWTDEEIVMRQDDLRLPIEDFIRKYDTV